MAPESFVARARLPAPTDEAFAWHERPGALQRLNPPWEPVEVVAADPGLAVGVRVELRMRLGPLPLRWVARHREYVPGVRFVDAQERGPFRRWVHTHSFRPLAGGGSELEDQVEYALPLGALGRAVAGPSIRRRLERMFDYRHTVLEGDLEAHRRAQLTPLTVVVSGASGLIGRALVAFLTTGGHTVKRLVRRGPADRSEIAWDPERGTLDALGLDGADAVIHLAGESVGHRWTAARKERILRSRVDGTRLLAEAIAKMPPGRRPKVLVSASAVGIYGAHPAGVCDEGSPPGDDFLARVCVEWEAAARAAADAGVRVVHPRFGVVLSPAGGALERLLTPFKLGVGGRVGAGTQPMSWITLDDAIYAVHHLLARPLAGPVNVVAPHPVSNAELTRTLGAVLHRPTALPLPSTAVRLLFGEMGDTVLLGGAAVVPKRLLEDGFPFRYPALEPALRHLLGRKQPTA